MERYWIWFDDVGQENLDKKNRPCQSKETKKSGLRNFSNI